MKKKMMSLALALVMCMTLCVPAFAMTSPQDSVPPKFLQINREKDIVEYSIAQAEYVEDCLDEIHQEIEQYQASILSPNAVDYGGFSYFLGDIIITESTSSAGIVGHVGIVVDSTQGKVLEITPKYNAGSPRVVSLATWFGCYPTAMVLRKGVSYGNPAANYGNSFYVNGSGRYNTYDLLDGMYSSNTDYCSSLVWKCYHYGAGFDFQTSYLSQGQEIWGIPTQILPYDFIIYRAHNGFTAVHSVNW